MIVASAAMLLVASACASSPETAYPPTTGSELADPVESEADDDSGGAETPDEGTDRSGPLWFGDHLAPGDCWNDTFDDAGEFDYSGTPQIVDCGDAHDNEVTATWILSGETLPDEDAIAEQADEVCGEAYAQFVGIEYGRTALDGFSVWPGEEDWEAGARRAVCSVYLRDARLAGSTRGIGAQPRPFDYPPGSTIPDAAVL